MTPLPPRRDLPDLQTRRRHLMSEIRTPARRPRRRLLLGGVLATVLAGGAAAVVLAALVGPGAESPDAGRDGTLRLAAASEVLVRASRRAGTEPELRPEPGQYLYFEERGEQDHFARMSQMGKNGEKKYFISRRGENSHGENWYPVGGQSPGMWRGGGEGYQVPWPGEIKPERVSGSGWICESYRNVSEAGRRDMKVVPDCKAGDDRYRRDLPTDVEAMSEWLYSPKKNDPSPPDMRAFNKVVETIRGHYVPPKSRAALFAAASRIPGTVLIEDVTDLVGRKGVAVGMAWDGVRSDLIFDAATFEFLGERTVMDYDASSWPLKGGENGRKADPELARYMKPGHIMTQSVILRVALVDERGQRP
ncbi:CU044_5270 family protein [Actinocorallia libanotica]|uniref:CU044_5270 family protein n=1 Tax=Actinocorallia libanotica TaxID=46162 RepID=A0ABN1Q8Z2_9ACTN